jgi:sporulation protein YlmC with PRC-barrel domain
MLLKITGVALLSATLLAGGAIARTTSTKGHSDKSTATTSMHREGQWRSSKLVGLNVYNEKNEKIGDINDIILDKSGKVDNVILGVGGFLGMGTHYVSVSYDKLKWDEQPVRTSSTSSTSSKSSATTTGTSTTNADRSSRSSSEKWYPDHAVYNATKDQLKAMPQFKY